MNRPLLLLIVPFGWLALELAAFMTVVQIIGLVGALLLGFATSLAGFALLRETGTSALRHIRLVITGSPQRQDAVFDGLIRAIGAILLILPGFVSDMVGLALAAPSLRQMVACRLSGTSAPSRGRAKLEIVDLAPGEWTSLEQRAEPAQH
jgi:UPF0716 protein FxsA